MIFTVIPVHVLLIDCFLFYAIAGVVPAI